MGRLVSIVYKPEDAVSPPDGYTRLPLQEASLMVGSGIEGDVKGSTRNRELNIMGADAVQALTGKGFAAAPGQLGEQLTLEDVDVDNLSVGAHVWIGESACVEVTEPRTGCGKFERYQGKPRTEAAGRMGVMARVIVDGIVRVGDPVRIVDASEAAKA